MPTPIPGGSPQTIAELLRVGLAADPDAPAIISRHARLTYAEVDDAAARAATVLTDLGVEAGDRVAGSMGNHSELAVAFLGAMRIGAIWLGINRISVPREVAAIVEDARPRLLIGDRRACETAPASLPVIEAEPGDLGSAWARLLAGASPAPLVSVDPHAPAAIAYTSGTTGTPKGVVHSQHNLLLPGAVARLEHPDPGGRPGVCLPLTILNLMILGPIAAFQQAQPCVLMDRVDAAGIADWVRRERITTFAAVPTIVHDLLTNPDVTDEDLASLRRPGVGGADCPEALKILYEEKYGTRLTQGYGLTEAPTVVATEDPADEPIPGCCGLPRPHVSVTIRDDDGAVLSSDAVGEICVGPRESGPFASVYTPMLGYWGDDRPGSGRVKDGVLHTGDLGFLDDKGRLFVTGRKGDLIIRGGANVYPAEVERVIAELPDVAAVAVVGIPDDRLGERVAAAIVPADGIRLEVESILDACRRELARYKIPEVVLVVDGLPRNVMRKVIKREVQALFDRDDLNVVYSETRVEEHGD